jgi:hypothetical protein
VQEIHALDDPAAINVQTRDNAFRQHRYRASMGPRSANRG